MANTKKKRPLAFRLKDAVARRIIAMSQPDVGRDQRREAQANAFSDNTEGLPSHILIENNNAATTVFSFASNALLFAGLPTFELRGCLNTLGATVNKVYLRDIHRQAYHTAPRGTTDGLEFYESEVRRAMQVLGATRHIAIGDSSGASAALYFATRCGMDKVIAFSPPFPLRHWTALGAQMQNLFNWRLLRESRYVYWEVLILGITSFLFEFDLRNKVGASNIWDPISTYKNATRQPDAVVFHGARCRPDREVAHLLNGVGNARIVAVDTGRHNCSTVLARNGDLQRIIQSEIAPVINRDGADPFEPARAKAPTIAPENPDTSP